MNKKILRITIPFTVVILTLFYFALITHWFGMPMNVGGNFCEAARDGLILQPVNSYSNIGFVISGLYCAWYLSHSGIIKNNPFYRSTFIPVFFCVMTVALGPCSMAMHATETHLGGLFDMNSMYVFAAFMFTYAITRFYKLRAWMFLVLYVSCIVFCNIMGLYHTVFGVDFYPGNAAFGLICVLGMLFEFLNFKKNKPVIAFKYAVYCSAAFLIAFGVWHFGYDGNCFCNPNSWFQWHGVWHLLCSLSTFYLFKYYVSEEMEQADAAKID